MRKYVTFQAKIRFQIDVDNEGEKHIGEFTEKEYSEAWKKLEEEKDKAEWDLIVPVMVPKK